MNLPSNSTRPRRWVYWLGGGLIALLLYAMLSAIVLFAGFLLLQRGIVSDIPWIAPVQKDLYMRGMRSIWQNKIDCVEADPELIYKPKIGTCHFSNLEFDTHLTFTDKGRVTGPVLAGQGIAVIGDSHAMGWGVEDLETFAAQLQQLSQRPVFNLAVSSYGTVRELHRLHVSGVLDDVDTIIIQYCNNDLKENQRGRLGSLEENRRKFAKVTRPEKSTGGLVRMVRKAYSFTFAYPFSTVTPRQPAESFNPHYKALLPLIEASPKLAKKRILVFYTNGNGEKFSDFPAGKDAQLNQVEFVDIELDVGDFHRLDDHLTPTGHRKIASQLFETISSSPISAR